MNVSQNKAKFTKMACVLKAIAHPTRLAIIQILEQKEYLFVNEICEVLCCEQSNVSHHLTNMKSSGILQSHKKGLNIYYSLKVHEVSKVISFL